MTYYVGTAGWSYPGGQGRWDGLFYPPKLADRDKLAYYARYFNSVELNSSFYRPPNPSAAERWAEQVPDSFRFTAKLWQKFTHPKMYEAATGQSAQLDADDLEVFHRGLEPLLAAGKLGPLLAQFPPSFKPTPASVDYLTDLVRELRAAGFALAVELRHRDWTAPHDLAAATRRLLEDERVAWVMIDEPKFRTSIREVPLTSDTGYFRFHGRNYAQWWHHDAAEDRYNYLYPNPEQAELAADVAEVGQRVADVYAFYNNHYGAKAVVNAIQLEADLGLPPRTPLPEALAAAYPELADLPSAAPS
jgi:uncharacterized protein YecE (DUF72 family)